MIRRAILILVACVLAAAAAYYWYVRHQAPSAATAQAPAAAPPPAEVGVIETRAAEVPLTLVYAGRVAGFRDVEIRPQVSGVLLKREFSEGAQVKQGQVLFRIDPRTYEVALARGQAQQAQAQASLRQAEENYKRIDELFKKGVATDKQLDDVRAAREQAQAAIQLAQADIRAAQLNLGYTTVTAPVTGITSLNSPAEGTLILAQQTVLTTISQLDPAYVNFSVTDAEYQSFRQLNERLAKPIREEDLKVQVLFSDGTAYGEQGSVDVSARAIDPRTGTLQVRAVLPNRAGTLLPGQFVRVTIRGIVLPDAIVIPKQAVSQGPEGPFVYVVGESNAAQPRPVRLGREVEAGWVVQEGLKPGERVVVDGIIRVRPGAPVRPVPMAAASASGASAAATGSAGARP
ncbi:MAG TPA: efflux RND transporter periplasmic adaptor subunit [Beijerinckiaceae bacterium]|nr:efflux RND transporter periplasmic adaptor subunit [Beijerinckiaceae bacterium]